MALVLSGGPSLQAQTPPGTSASDSVITNSNDLYRIQERKSSDLDVSTDNISPQDSNSARYKACYDYATGLASHDYNIEKDRSGVLGSERTGGLWTGTLGRNRTTAEEKRIWRKHFNRCLESRKP